MNTNHSEMNNNKLPIIQLTESDKADIIRMRKQGETVKSIAEYIGCTASTIYRCLKKYGMAARKSWSEEEDELAMQMYNAGAGSSEIAECLGKDRKKVWSHLMYLRKLGHKLKYKRK